MADGTKAVVDTSVADEAALAMALEDIPVDDTPVDVPDGRPTDDAAADASPASTSPADAPSADARSGDASTRDGVAGASEREQPAEATAPLSTAELAAELTAGATEAVAAAEPAGSSEPAASPVPEKEEAEVREVPAGTGALPLVLPAPLHHSGDRIADRYRLEECITQSEVFSSWRAVDEKLRRAVGVHLLAAGHQRAKAVLAAAKAAALLGDPRFVQVLDAVEEGELVYVIREWLPGASDLAQVLATGPLEPYDVYQMIRQVTDAIASAHKRGQAHLRLTPRCVLRTDGGQYRINGIAVDAALRGLPDDECGPTDARAIGALLYAALTHRWPYPEDRYDLQGLPKDLGCVPPDQVKAGVHKGLSEIAARVLCEHPPHHQEPITSPEQLAKAISLMPKIRPPEPPAPPAFAPPRYAQRQPAQSMLQVTRPLAEPILPPAPTLGRRRRGLRRVAKWTAAAVALAAIGAGSWQLADRLLNPKTRTAGHPAPVQGGSATPGAPSGHRITISSAQQFNALGTGAEHPDDAKNSIDGDPATVWPTQGYFDPLHQVKDGTGLLIDLGSAQRVGSVHVQFVGDTTVELRAAPTETSRAPSADKTGLAVFGAAVARSTGSEVDLKPADPLTTRYLLIWLTDIPKDGANGYQGKVAEIQVTS